MADVRALLKAKREEVKITHPLASYNRANQLKCSACGTLIKHSSAWEGHLGSKGHRTTIARLKGEATGRGAQRRAEEAEEAWKAQVVQGKRKAEEEREDDDDVESKRRKVGDAQQNVVPANFFSDPSRTIPTSQDEESDEDVSMKAPSPTQLHQSAPNEIDLEYERFQREMRLNAEEQQEAYQRATVVAEPALTIQETPEGFPNLQAEPITNESSQKRDEEEARKRKEHEERELIMDRLMDEERAQEEADMRVTAMKARLDALRKKREFKRAVAAS